MGEYLVVGGSNGSGWACVYVRVLSNSRDVRGIEWWVHKPHLGYYYTDVDSKRVGHGF